MIVTSEAFITDRKQAIENSLLQHKFFMTYVFPPFITEWEECSQLVSYYLPNALSSHYNMQIEFVISGTHLEFKNSIPHFHSIGASSKPFWNDRKCKPLLDKWCLSLAHRRKGLVMSSKTELSNMVTELKEKHSRFKCDLYDPTKEGVRYIYSHHTLIPYDNPIFDRRRSQRKKKKNV